jgi:hypothetical protein
MRRHANGHLHHTPSPSQRGQPTFTSRYPHMHVDATFTLLSCCHTNRSEEVLFVAPRTACRHAVLEIHRIRKTTAVRRQQRTLSCADSTVALLILNHIFIFVISPLSLVPVACCALSNIRRAATSTDYKDLSSATQRKHHIQSQRLPILELFEGPPYSRGLRKLPTYLGAPVLRLHLAGTQQDTPFTSTQFDSTSRYVTSKTNANE